MDRDRLINIFFHLGMTHKEILYSLASNGIILSRRHLIRILKAQRLCRRRYSALQEVIYFINQQLRGPGRHNCYRWMYGKCLGHGLLVQKEDARLILSQLDPVGTLARRR
ncbi:hypothetical protein GJAV_G00014790 [Gymnothorax javanicus]|nr:hypothetical protein GJAV_G00014790 [Gymnothorax javanicus]